MKHPYKLDKIVAGIEDSSFSILEGKIPTDRKIKEEILTYLDLVDESLLFKLRSLPLNTQKDIEHEMAYYIYSQFLNLSIFKQEEDTTNISHNNVRIAINHFSAPIIMTLIETYLSYTLAKKVAETKISSTKEIDSMISRSFDDLLYSEKRFIKKIIEEILTLPEDLKNSILKTSKSGASQDVLQSLLKAKRSGLASTEERIELLLSLLPAISKTMLSTRLELAISLIKENSQETQEITIINRPEFAENFLDHLKNFWLSDQSFHLFLIDTESENYDLFRKKILSLKSEFLSLESVFIETEIGIIIQIPNTEMHNLKAFVESIEKDKDLSDLRTKVAYSFFNKKLFLNKFREYGENLELFLDEIVFETIITHLREGKALSESSLENKTIIACGKEIISSSDFKYGNEDNLSLTQLSYIEDLAELTRTYAYKNEAFMPSENEIIKAYQDELTRGDLPSQKSEEETIKANDKYPFGATIVGATKAGTSNQKTTKKPPKDENESTRNVAIGEISEAIELSRQSEKLIKMPKNEDQTKIFCEEEQSKQLG